MPSYFKAKFDKGLPRANVKNVMGNPIVCLLNNEKSEHRPSVFCKKGTCVLVSKDMTVDSKMAHYRVYFYDGRVLLMAEAACQFYLKTERTADGKVIVDNKFGPKFAERFENALGPSVLAVLERKIKQEEHRNGNEESSQKSSTESENSVPHQEGTAENVPDR
jgi:hypothetical protein